MDFEQLLRRRKMVRSFQDRPLPPGTADRIVANGLRAPSAGFTQGWAFVLLEGREETERYWAASFPDPAARASFQWPGLLRAPLLIVVLGDEGAYVARYAEADKRGRSSGVGDSGWPAPWWYVDTAFAASLMLLTAVDAGLGALFFGMARREAVMAELGVPDRYTPAGVLAVGYPAPDDRPSVSVARGRRRFDDVVHRGGW